MKKFLSLLLVVVLSFTLCFAANAQEEPSLPNEEIISHVEATWSEEPTSAQPDERPEFVPPDNAYAFDEANNIYYYTLDNGKATVIYVEQSYGYTDVVAEVNGYPVEAIGDYAYADAMLCDDISIPQTVEKVGEGVFGNNEITTVIIYPTLESVGKDAFAGCTVESVWFLGTKDEFDAIEIADGNEPLLEAEFCDKYKVSSLIREYGFEYFLYGMEESLLYGVAVFLAPIALLVFPPVGIAALTGPFMSVATFFVSLYEALVIFFESFSVL